ncbi:MAG: outer membrane protein TolC, partial [Oleispira sp.]
ARELLGTTQKAYQRGQYSVLQWIDAQNKVFNLEQDLINSQVRIFNQVLELERILGQSIVSTQ